MALVRALVEEDRFFRAWGEPGIHSSKYPQRALQRIGAPAIPELLKALYNDDWVGSERSGRRRAAQTLGYMRDRAAVAGLVKALVEAGDDVRPSVVLALGYIGDPAAVPGLVRTLREDPVTMAREWAADSLERIADPSAVPDLVEAGLGDPASMVRGKSANALGAIGDEAAVPGLMQMLRDRDDWVASRAAGALKCIGSEDALAALEARRGCLRGLV